MLLILKPFVLSALKSPKFKTFVVELLEKLVEQTDNELDDKARAMVKKGLYANIHAKRLRIRKGSGETMRKPGTKGAPTAANFKRSAKTAKKY